MNNFLDIFINKSTEITETSYSTYLFIIGLAMFVISFFIDGNSYRYKNYVVLDFFKKKKEFKKSYKRFKKQI